MLDKTFDETLGWEVQNSLTVAKLVAMSALDREESIGIHHRADAKDASASSLYHVMVTRDAEGTRPRRTTAASPRVGDG